jgi:hypothetical protein
MGKKSPKTILKERIEELNGIFAEVSADKMKIVGPTIVRLAKMEQYLVSLEDEIDKVGFTEVYQNGANQSGTKESTASRSYSTVVKNYNALVRTLLTLLPEDSQQEASDGFEEFLQRRT